MRQLRGSKSPHANLRIITCVGESRHADNRRGRARPNLSLRGIHMYNTPSFRSVCASICRINGSGARCSGFVLLGLGMTVMLLSACEDPVSPLDSDRSSAAIESLLGQDTAAGKAAIGDALVFTFADMTEVGTSRLVRTPNGVNYKLSTSGLQPGHAYTLWIVAFNNTDGCEFGSPGFSLCGPDDVVNDAARPDMMYAGGHVAGGSGLATFAGRLNVDDLSGSINEPVGVPAYGLEDPQNAEIHLAVHDHGPKMGAYMPDMIKTIDGGCTDAGIPEAGAPSPWNEHEFGRQGPNTCSTIHFAVHSPDAL